MQAAPDGSLYLAGPNIYKVDVNTGNRSVVLPIRDWQRSLYASPDVLYAWPAQTPTQDFSLLYVDLQTGETEAREFAPSPSCTSPPTVRRRTATSSSVSCTGSPSTTCGNRN
jgi:hypothetical protein